ncbi:hypothetical protein ACLMJK_009594 [Lecanora helva]
MATHNADLSIIPTIKAPPGLHSNLVDPPHQTLPTILGLILFIMVSAPFVALRMYTRRYITRKLWWDDWTCLLGWVFLVVLGGLMIKGLDYGMGSDMWNVSKAKHKHFTKLFHDIEIIARVGMFFTKASIILLYHRLFIPHGTCWTGTWWSIWLAFWWNLLYAIALVLTVSFECLGKDALVAQGKACVDEYAILISASVINVSTDVIILIIPLVAIWGLHMPREKKWRLSTVFAVGTLGLLASVARLAYQIPEADQPNTTMITMVLLLLNAAEQFIGIIVCCMPILPAFYRHIKAYHQHHLALFPQQPLSPSDPSSSSGGSPTRLKKFTTNSFIAPGNDSERRQMMRKSGARDPYPVYSTRGYEELDELERGKGEGIVRELEVSVVSERSGCNGSG